ncbi:MAG: hypothetical protein IT372_31090 [Polyangiaceae bacterium]|nr:hypothetical protein [Polyangiaceae bacterium]
MRSEAVRRAGAPGEARARAIEAFEAAQGVGEGIAGPLLRAALERLAAAYADPGALPAPWAGWGAVAALRPGIDADDAAALAALGEALGPPEDGRRPIAGPAADRFAFEHGEIGAAAARARQSWGREAPWDALDVSSDGVPLWSSIAVPRDVALPAGADAGAATDAGAGAVTGAGAGAVTGAGAGAVTDAGAGAVTGAGAGAVTDAGAGAATDAREAAQCESEGPHGLRWTVLDGRRAEIDVDAPPGAYARVLLRGLSAEPEKESAVIVDGFAASVHAGAGVASVLAVAPGERAFERPPGAPPVLARIPREGKAPCAGLREVTQWAWVESAASFTVPDLERATVARVVVAPTSVAVAAGALPTGPAHVIRVRAGGVPYDAWVRPGATGAIEVPVPRGAGALRVETNAPALLRASARLHPAPPPPPRALTPKGGGPTAPIEILLETIRGATRGLRGLGGAARSGRAEPPSAGREAEPARSRLRAQRATALELLGFPGLAGLDRPPADDGEPLDAEVGPSATFALPPGSPPVVPLGMLARVDPLPLPEELGPLRAARAARGAGDPRRGFKELVGPAGASSGADALLLGLLAERSGEARAASDAFARIGVERGSGPALARAASLATDVAAADRERVSVLRAFALAELSVQAGEPPPGALARLAPVIAWRAPPRADRTAGTAPLEIRAKADRDLPLRVRARRALIDAPEGALLVTEGAYAQFHVRFDGKAGGAVALDGACRALDAEETPCALAVTLDGAPAACEAAAAGALRCAVQVPRGAHRIEVRPPSDRALLAWVRAVGPGPAAAYRGRVMSTWQDIDPERPLELAFAGPTVVRVRARAAYECAEGVRGPGRGAGVEAAGEDPTCHPEVATAAPAGALRWSVEPIGEGAAGRAAVAEGALELDGAEDRTARRSGVNRPPFFWLGNEVEQRIAVLPEGPHALRVASPAGRALVRVEIAVATGAPRPREQPAPAPPQPESPSIEALRMAPRVGEDPGEGPLRAGAYAHLVDADLSEDELRASTRFLELGIDARREIVAGRAWAGLAGFGRLRAGTPSVGVEGLFDTAGDGWIPAVSVLGRAVLQPPAAGGRAAIGATWAIPLDVRGFGSPSAPGPLGELTLLPWASLGLLAVDERLRGVDGADRDVFTPYAASHTTLGSLGARVRLRPAVDAIVSAGPSLRLSPLFSTLDRVDLRVDVDLLPGRGLYPWIQAGWLWSFRPENETREDAFLRHVLTASATFWSWISRSNRVSLAGEGSFLFDVPGSSIPAPRLGAGLLARYDWTGGRGLRDLPPRETPFRDRLEEGSGRVEREPPAAEPSWEEEPE